MDRKGVGKPSFLLMLLKWDHLIADGYIDDPVIHQQLPVNITLCEAPHLHAPMMRCNLPGPLPTSWLMISRSLTIDTCLSTSHCVNLKPVCTPAPHISPPRS